MTSSLVGSEMCIRDRGCWCHGRRWSGSPQGRRSWWPRSATNLQEVLGNCLLYTSDAADDM
eukprot:6253646-Prorocentrum_lima.AAC.1